MAVSLGCRQYECLNELSKQMGGPSKLWGSVLALLDLSLPSELRELGAKLTERYDIVFSGMTCCVIMIEVRRLRDEMDVWMDLNIYLVLLCTC